MDPYQTYQEMYSAMRNGDTATARDLALALKLWFANGGFYPHQHTPEAMHAYIVSVLRRTAGDGPQPFFSLVCRDCDAGEGIATEEDAIGEGWSEIGPAFELLQANYCGICPDCRARLDAEATK